MTNFTQVNNGVAFSYGEDFEEEDANALRSNGDLTWLANLRNLASADIDMSVLVGGSGSSGFGPVSWSEYAGAYITLGGKPVTAHYIASAGPGGPVTYGLVSMGSATPDVVTRPSALFTVHSYEPSMSYPDYYVLAYHNYSSTTSITVGYAEVSSPGSIVFSAPAYSSLAFALGLSGASGVHVGAAPSSTYLIPGSVGAQSSLLKVVGEYRASYLADVTATILTGAHAGGEVTSLAVNADRSVAVGICSTAAYVICYTTAGGTVTEYAAPLHADVETDLTFRRIAFDPRMGAFVVMTIGNHASTTTNGRLYWATSSDGATWSATVGWKKAFIERGPYSGNSTGVFFLEDFTITADGIWVVLISSQTNRYRMFASNDSGATWHGVGGWVRNSGAGAKSARFSSEGPSLCIIESPSTVKRTISVGGASFDTAQILSSAA